MSQQNRIGTRLAAAVRALAAFAPAVRATPPSAEAGLKYFTDVVLVDQTGKEQRLYSDLLHGKVVIIHSMFTSCTTACPAMAARLEKVQRWLGDRLGKDAFILSISVDPKRDTPEKMAAFGESFRARQGWYFLTGEPANVELALKKLGQWVDDPESHLSVMIIGNERTGLWKKALGMAEADELIEIVESVLTDQG